jgi:iron complex transport system substrate-binding protein
VNRVAFWFAGLVFFAVAFVACGGDDDGGTSPGGLTPTLEATRAPVPYEPFDCEKEYPGAEPDASNFPLRLADDTGVQVELEAPPQAIVSLSAAHVEVLYAIGAGNQVAAGDLFSNCPAAARELPKVDAFTPSVEAITALEPDLVFIFFDPGGLRDSLEGAGIKVFMLNTPESVTGVFDQIELVGQMTGHLAEAGALVSGMNGRINEIVAGLPGVEPPTVFHEVDNTLFTVGPGSFIDNLYEILGAQNIAEETGQAYPQMSNEAVIASAPQVIILADEVAGESAETVRARPGWDSIPAVQNGRIHAVNPDIVSRPGPRLIEALETLGRLLYGEAFGS